MKIYWLHSPHCHASYLVNTMPFLDRRTNQVHDHVFVCRHPVVDGKEQPATDRFQKGKSRFSFLTAWLNSFR